MTKRLQLKVEKRKILGKKVKKLRKEGLLPGNLYGKTIKSQAVQASLVEFEKISKEAGETQIVELSLNSTLHPVLIQNLQLDPRTGNPLHADFYQVDLKEKIKAMIPVEPIGEPKAVAEKIGLLLQPLSEIEIEALPTDLPEKIEVDVTNLETLEQQITVVDLKVPANVQVLTDPSQVVFKIGALVSKEAEELAKQEEAAAAAAAAETAAEQGEAPAEEKVAAETPTEESKKEEAPPPSAEEGK